MTDQTDSSSELSSYEDSQSSQSSNNDDPINDPSYSMSQDSAFYSDED